MSVAVRLENVTKSFALRSRKSGLKHLLLHPSEWRGKNRKEIYPLVNFCFLNNADNQKIKDKAPSDYVSLMNPDSIMEILESAICPKDTFTMTYEEFVEVRTKLLLSYANELISG